MLFAAKKNSIKSYPILLIYNIKENEGTPAKFLITVPKKRVRHAVDRVAMRRRIREAYRLNRSLFFPALKDNNLSVDIALLYIGDTLDNYHHIEAKMKNALSNLSSIITEHAANR